jgi:transcriptional regulator with XRE-family HTH domain
MAGAKTGSFGRVIRERRRQLDLTQEEVAQRIKTSIPYIGHLEAGKRHPSSRVVIRLADTLGLDARELFLLANPRLGSLISEPGGTSAWDAFVKDVKLRKIPNITDQEMETLSQVAKMGEVRAPRDFIFILNTTRHALGT